MSGHGEDEHRRPGAGQDRGDPGTAKPAQQVGGGRHQRRTVGLVQQIVGCIEQQVRALREGRYEQRAAARGGGRVGVRDGTRQRSLPGRRGVGASYLRGGTHTTGQISPSGSSRIARGAEPGPAGVQAMVRPASTRQAAALSGRPFQLARLRQCCAVQRWAVQRWAVQRCAIQRCVVQRCLPPRFFIKNGFASQRFTCLAGERVASQQVRPPTAASARRAQAAALRDRVDTAQPEARLAG